LWIANEFMDFCFFWIGVYPKVGLNSMIGYLLKDMCDIYGKIKKLLVFPFVTNF